MIKYFGMDVHRINHALKVYGFAGTICREEKLKESEIFSSELAAILHDIGIPEAERKYNSFAGKYQEMEGPSIARSIMEKLPIDPEIIDRVCYMIGNHHSYNKIDGQDFQILVEADFLVNIFEDKMDQRMIESIRKKNFRTTAGIFILNMLYSLS